MPAEHGSNQRIGAPESRGPGKGIWNFLKRLWFNFIVVFIGGKWSLIETLTKHRKLNKEEIPNDTKGQTVVITGGARGIGAEVVKQCLLLEMHVIIGCRRPSAGEATIQAIREQGIHTGTVEALPLDLNSLASVRQFAQAILLKNTPIHRLFNNAGVMFTPFQLTTDGLESQWQTNYLSHFLLTILLEPALQSGGTPDQPARVINVSSAAQYGGHIDFDNVDGSRDHSAHLSYMCSKLAQVVSTVCLNRRYTSQKMNIRVYALHPGVVRTDLYVRVWWVNLFGRLLNVMFKTPEQGADGVMYVAFSPWVSSEGGTFYANCREEPVNPLALSTEVQEKLYKISKGICDQQQATRTNANGVTVNVK